MSANRKLQTEVDRVLKKVEEGVEIFDDIWEKVYSAPQQSLKEKYEADLKKEIKKLQRLRDQIKTWISSGDIKDKSALTEARKLIEVKMEEFKVCEKETKTKAFSKEGLAREEKLGPRELEKEEKRSWIQSVVERIEAVVESLEADLEKLTNATKGKSKHKDQIEKLEAGITTNRWHISKLELIHRLLDNDSLEPSLLDGIKEELEYYLECIESDDGNLGVESDDYNIYEELQLDALSLGGGPGHLLKADGDGKEGDEDDDEDAPVEELPSAPSLVATISSGAKPKKVATVPQSLVAPIATAAAAPASGKPASVVPAAGGKTAAAVVAGAAAKSTPVAGLKSMPGQKTAAAIVAGNISSNSTPTVTAAAKTPAVTAAKIVSGDKKAAPVQAKPDVVRKEPAPVVPTTPLAGSWAHAATTGQRIASAASAVNSPQPNTTPKQPTLAPPLAPPVENLPQAASDSDSKAVAPNPAPANISSKSVESETVPAPKSNPTTTQPSPPLSAKPMPSPVLTAKNNPEPLPTAVPVASVSEPAKASASRVTPTPHTQPSQQPQSQSVLQHQTQTQQTLPPHVLSSPGSQSQQGLPPPHRPASVGSGSQELQALAHMLKMSMIHIPPTDVSNDRSKPYTPRNPFPGQLHPSFPTTPHPIVENSALFERLPMDSLFLSFYYQQGSYQQYLAAKQLKKHSWRFHKKYMTWFQRHEEPKTTTNDYEEGTYVYFDYESGWCQRIKSEFKFEYAYLEDELTQAANTLAATQQQHPSPSNA